MPISNVDVPNYPFGIPQADDDDSGLARLRDEAPVCQVRLPDGQLGWLVTRYQDIKQVLTDPNLSRAATIEPGAPSLLPGVNAPGMMINMDPPEHTRVRRLVARAFTARAVDRLRPRIEAIASGLLDDLAAAGPPGDLLNGFTRPLTTTVICELLGIPFADRDRMDGLVELLGAEVLPPMEEMMSVLTAASGYLLELIARRRAEPADDVLSALVAVHDEDNDQLSTDELLQTALLIFVAGHDTTLNQLANSVRTLVGHPDQLARLLADPTIYPAAAEELLRFVRLTSATFGRIATADTEVGGVPIRAGEAVFPIFHSGNRDPAAFDRPDELDLTRAGAANQLQFGHGIHHCLGAALARAELDIGLRAIFTRFPTLRLAADDADLSWLPNTAVRRLRGLPVSW